jgi:hypothetical protein
MTKFKGIAGDKCGFGQRVKKILSKECEWQASESRRVYMSQYMSQ